MKSTIRINGLITSIILSVFLFGIPMSAYALLVGSTIIETNADTALRNDTNSDSDYQSATTGTVSASAYSEDIYYSFPGATIDTTATAQSLTTVDGVMKSTSEFNGAVGPAFGGYASSSTSWSTTYTNDTSSSQSYLFNFTIHSGELNVNPFWFDYAEEGDFMQAWYFADVSVNGISLFDSSATLGAEVNANHDLIWYLTETGTSLGTTGFYTASWGDYTDNLLLGTFSPSEVFTVTYTLGTVVEGMGIFGLQYEGGVYGASMYARFDDPFDVSVVSPDSVTTVPEPATFALFGIGLVGINFSCRRLANQANGQVKKL